MNTPVVIAAGGVDPGGGAGLGMDVAFLARLGVRVAPVVTALTVQTDRGVQRVSPVEAPLFEEQLLAALETVGPAVRVVKTGLIVRSAQAAVVARCAADHGLPLVVDPILAAGSGDAFVRDDPASVLLPLIKAASLLTPNIAEAARLANQDWDGTADGLLRLARALAGPLRAVAVTGGEARGPVVYAAIAGPGGEKLVEAPRAEGGPFHGTGCAFAAAAAGYMALGLPALDAAAAAHRLVAQALASAKGIPGTRLSPEPWSV